jgi:hypothetical protein
MQKKGLNKEMPERQAFPTRIWQYQLSDGGEYKSFDRNYASGILLKEKPYLSADENNPGYLGFLP